jgi:hypothetical protein
MRRMLRAILIASGMAAVLPFLLFAQTHNRGELALKILGVGFLVGTVYFALWTNLNKFLAATASVRSSASGSGVIQNQTSLTPEASGKYAALLSMPRPRPVRMTQAAKETLRGTYIAVGVLAATLVMVLLPLAFVDSPSVTRDIHQMHLL